MVDHCVDLSTTLLLLDGSAKNEVIFGRILKMRDRERSGTPVLPHSFHPCSSCSLAVEVVMVIVDVVVLQLMEEDLKMTMVMSRVHPHTPGTTPSIMVVMTSTIICRGP